MYETAAGKAKTASTLRKVAIAKTGWRQSLYENRPHIGSSENVIGEEGDSGVTNCDCEKRLAEVHHS